MAGQYDLPMVVLSLSIAILASFMGFLVSTQAAMTSSKRATNLLLGVGSLALGAGIWAMHFVGMLAFTLCTPVNFSLFITIVSMLPSIAASWVGLKLLTQKHTSIQRLVLSGVLMGLGVGAMHYVGMAAMEMAPLLRYDFPLFFLSLIVAILLAILALWIRFALQAMQTWRPSLLVINFIASVVMGGAIAGMHYTGMLAARFVKPPGLELSQQTSDISMYLAAGVTFVAVVIILIVMGFSLLVKYRAVSRVAKDGEERYRILIESAVDAVLTIDSKGKILSANNGLTPILGWRPADVIGQSLHLLIPKEKRYLYDDDFFMGRDSATSEGLIGINREVKAINYQGHSVPVRISLNHAIIGEQHFYVLFIADIRERIEMEQALKINEEKLRSLIANIPGIAYRCLDQDDWPMVYISDAVESITGYPAEDFLLPNPTIQFSDLFHPDDLAIIRGQHPQDKSNYTIEYRIIDRFNKVRWLREQGSYVKNEQGKTIWLDGFIMDISDRKIMENELIAAKEVAEQAAAARAAFLANMSHEIRTPMNSVIGFSDILLDTPLNTEQHKHLSTINGSARSLLHLLNDILDSAKLDKGKLDIDSRVFVLTEEVDTVVSTFWLDAKRKGLNLNVEVAPGLSTLYQGAPERIRQVLNNLVGNAVKFTSRGDVTLSIQCGDKPGDISFIIEDTGIGMTREQLDKVFDAFTQADDSMSRKFAGTGLGTTISKQLVELMGGTISVSSQKGKGTCFRFTLPLSVVHGPIPKALRTQISLPPLSILVVDDIEQNVELLKVLFERSGHKIDIANNGKVALDKMRDGAFDVVLMDLQMPVMDGLTAAIKRREYESSNNLKQLPIVALTASVLAQDKKAAHQAGMEGFANKPIDYPVLCRVIASVLGLEGSALSYVPTQLKTHTIDWSRGESLWGSRDALVKEITTYVKDFQQHKIEFQAAIDDNDYTHICSLSHRYKGVAGNLGLTALMTTLHHMEKAAREQAPCDPLWQEVLVQLAEVFSELGNQQRLEPMIVNDDINISALLKIATEVLACVQTNHLEEPLLQQFSTMPSGIYCKQVRIICDTLDEFEFQQAEQGLKRLIEELSQ
jgi:PAS domain S-box-containing protein